jgi:AhpD family alkylhydroperoxidase
MDEQTKILVCISAAVASNCVPCFRHYAKKAESAGIDPRDVQEAVTMGAQVKTGAHTILMAAVEAVSGHPGTEGDTSCCGSTSGTSCVP